MNSNATFSLPPRVAEIANGSVSWERIDGIDFELLGYFLSCHLIIEHYIDEYLKVYYPKLEWGSAHLTFNQKVALLSRMKVSDRYHCIPSIKHLNSLRNKLSHQVAFPITTKELQPMSSYLEKVSEGKLPLPTDPREILEKFTTMTCVLFAGLISGRSSISD